MSHSDHLVMARETRRDANTSGRKTGRCVPEGLGAERSHSGAVAGTSVHGPMT